MTLATRLHGPLTGRHVLAALVGFFLVVFAVNGVFLYVSLSSHPGVSTEDAYRKGLNYNAELEEVARQRALGWQGRFETDGARLALRLSHADGGALSGADVVLLCRRPTHDGDDRRIVLTETAPGLYTAPRLLLPAGRWALRADVSDAGGHSFRIEDDIVVQR